MRKVVIVTDSTAGLPPESIQRLGIRVAPLTLIWGNETFRDGVDISTADFYKRLQSSKLTPSTSQVTVEEFRALFSSILEAGHSVLGVFISGGLSGTVESALQAKLALHGAPIQIVDSRVTCIALGFAALAAARAVQGGAELDEATAIARKAVDGAGIMFAVDTLEYLHRGGRIGGAAKFIGTALNMKPILEVQDGKVAALERVRTKTKAKERMLDIFAERIGDRKPLRLSALHAAAEEEGRELLEEAVRRFQPEESLLTETSPVIGTHVGPGTVGLAYCTGV